MSIITKAPLASAPASIPAVTTPPPVITTPQQTTGPAVSTQLPVSAPSSPPASKVPLPELCSDPKWTPSPENWEDANVDTELANWWTSTTAARGSATFVDWISQSFGDRSRNQQCGIGLIASCSMPDCQGQYFFATSEQNLTRLQPSKPLMGHDGSTSSVSAWLK